LTRLSISPLLLGIPCHLVMVGGEAEQLAEARTVLQNAGIEVEVYALTGDVESGLLEHIRQEQIDLVIMGAYGHSRLRQFFLGSHTSRMLSQSPVPLLLLR
jgi:nucleotide-binding universal stress UspA family protein